MFKMRRPKHTVMQLGMAEMATELVNDSGEIKMENLLYFS